MSKCLSYTELWNFASIVKFNVEIISETAIRLYKEGGVSFLWEANLNTEQWCALAGVL